MQIFDQNILFEKSEALNLQPMSEYAKVICVISVSLLKHQGHWTHNLC